VTRYLIDTSYVVDVLNEHEPEASTLRQLAEEGMAISLITYGELYEGAYYAHHRDEALKGLQEFLRAVELLPLTTSTIERFAIVRGALPRQARQQVGDMDLLIAATAMERSLVLVTNNLRDFRLVPELVLYKSD
jgi:predicted nucleic acid-binding protein